MNEHEIDEQREINQLGEQSTSTNRHAQHHNFDQVKPDQDGNNTEAVQASDLQLSALFEKSKQEQVNEQHAHNKVQELYINWLELLIQDQLAISQLLQAETTHIEAFISNEIVFSSYPTRQELVAFQETVGNVFDALNERQRIHLKLIDASLKLFKQGDTYGI